MQPNHPEDPYGQQQPPPGYGQQPPPPYGQQPPPPSPYGQRAARPYGQPPGVRPATTGATASNHRRTVSRAGSPTPRSSTAAATASPAPRAPNNTFGVISLVTGILSIPFSVCCFGIFAFALAIAAIMLGILGSKKADQGQATNKGQARAGLICGIVGVVLGVGWNILSLVSTFDTPLPGF